MRNPLEKRPSEYLRDHIRMERPDNDEDMLHMLRMMDAEHLLMFSSDYPHWDFDSPQSAFPKLPEKLYNRIFFENAEAFYGLK
nr:amidohydrolase family protein [Paenibacillus sp. 1_12]